MCWPRSATLTASSTALQATKVAWKSPVWPTMSPVGSSPAPGKPTAHIQHSTCIPRPMMQGVCQQCSELALLFGTRGQISNIRRMQKHWFATSTPTKMCVLEANECYLVIFAGFESLLGLFCDLSRLHLRLLVEGDIGVRWHLHHCTKHTFVTFCFDTLSCPFPGVCSRSVALPSRSHVAKHAQVC